MPRTHPSPLLSLAHPPPPPASIRRRFPSPDRRHWRPLTPQERCRLGSSISDNAAARRRRSPPQEQRRPASPSSSDDIPRQLIFRAIRDINFHLADIAAPLIPVTGERLFHLHCSCCHPRPHCIYVLDLYLSLTTIQEGRPRSDLSWVPSVPTIKVFDSILMLRYFMDLCMTLFNM
ncbi:uncharacterized protein LOC127765936 [Oryza glaberrima]|uniref:uncharacterized protein LOC127765936 n=1 Tax=Oryza glaberrima TaxID=4538 RepID=UPI00224C1222|nr:uncharacterized protein LOC127765936 [Oryza glaberrima]